LFAELYLKENGLETLFPNMYLLIFS